MRRKSVLGGAYVEFALSLLVLMPLFLGVTGLGISMLRQLQTIQVARDSASMYARKVDFTLNGNQGLLSQIAGSLDLTAGSGTAGAAGSGNVVVILSTIQYVNASICAQASPSLAANTTSCPNFGSWVFAKRVVVGNNTLIGSSLGTPNSTYYATSDGAITINNQCLQSDDKVTGTNPWASSSIPAADLAVIQVQPIYVSEAAAVGFRMPPFSAGTTTYAQFYF